jgi:hypothetical protein
LPWAFSNESRPLVDLSKDAGATFPLVAYDRRPLYFANRGSLYQRYVQVANDIRRKNATNIGLIASGDGWEYPLWVLIKEGTPATVRIEHVEVKNASGLIPRADFRPDYYVRLE